MLSFVLVVLFSSVLPNVLAIPTLAERGVTVPLSKRSAGRPRSGPAYLAWAAEEAVKLRTKYNRPAVIAKRAQGTNALTNQVQRCPNP